MASKITLNSISDFSFSAIAVINQNFTDLANKIDTLLSRDGDTPNAMEGDLDMDSNDILNVGTINGQDANDLKGDAATVTIGTTTTLAVGEEATVTNSGDTNDAIFNFGIPGAQSYYTYIAWASDDSGTDFTTTFDTNLDYIAVIVSETEIETPAAGDFAGNWKQYANATDVAAAAASAAAAATSESNAATSETNAATSASNASTSETNALASAGAASASEIASAASESAAATSESNAATSETNAATSASNAATSETNASTSETNAASSASAASSAQTAAEAARDQTLSSFDSFDDRYLGAKASNPSLDNDGDPLLAGALYFNTSSEVMMLYTGSTWVAAYVSGSGFLAASNNLSDVDNATTALSNLGAAAASHTHDDRYYTETETDTLLSGKSDTSHNHTGVYEPVDADILRADTADVLTAGYAATPYNNGEQTSGTLTPDEANGNFQYAENGGAHTLAPPTNNCTIVIQYTNNSSAGAITTSGFTKVDGEFDTTDGNDFFAYITKLNGFSHLNVVALQ